MKKIKLLVAILLQCLCVTLFAQWQQVSSIPTTQLNAVNFFDANTGITVGVGGIWRSTNGGANWLQVLSGSNLNALSFINPNLGLAVGDSGKIFRTLDMGVTWNQQTPVTTNNLYGVHFVTSINAYAVGQNGIFLDSYSAGASWGIRYAFNQDLYVVFMFPNESGFAAGASNSEFFTTTGNGGINWIPTLEQAGPKLNSISPVTGQYTYVLVGNAGRIRRTTNSGSTWTLPSANTTFNLYGVIFVDANSGWLCGQNGLIENSINGGTNWSVQSTSVNNDLHGICFINNTIGWSVGSNGLVLRTGIPLRIQRESIEIPMQFKLYQNYPNPFNPITTIRFSIPKFQNGAQVETITLKVYDANGSEMCVLVDEKLQPGTYGINFNCTNLSSGIYFYALFVNQKVSGVKKLVLIK